MKIEPQTIAKIFIEAFDMDIQKFLNNVIQSLSQSYNGQNVIMWAKNNPLKFNLLLHLISITIQQIPKDKGLLLDAVKNQLVRLPAEVFDVVEFQTQSNISIGDYNRPSLQQNNEVLIKLLEDKFNADLKSSLDDKMTSLKNELALIMGVVSKIFFQIGIDFSDSDDSPAAFDASKLNDKLLNELASSDVDITPELYSYLLNHIYEAANIIYKSISTPNAILVGSVSDKTIELALSRLEYRLKNAVKDNPEDMKELFTKIPELENLLSQWIKESKPEYYTKILLQFILTIKRIQ